MNVLIVGGGIAGLSGALWCARAGHRVTVAEQQAAPIDRVCGEGILPFGVAMLEELGLAQDARDLGFPFQGVSYICEQRSAEGHFPAGSYGLGIARGLLDALLRDAVQAAGVTLWQKRTIRPDTPLPFDRVLAADGIHSRWGRAQGLVTRHGSRRGVRFRLQTQPPPRVRVYFHKGYEIYLTPTGAETLSVAFLMEASVCGKPKEWAPQAFRRHFREYAHLPLLDPAVRAPITAAPQNAFPPLHLLGDACQAFDPISGAGMSFALLCGKLAARSLEEPSAYWHALAPHRRALGAFTNLVLFFRGGGLRSRLMVRQLARSPRSFNRILALHDGVSSPLALGPRHALGLLKP